MSIKKLRSRESSLIKQCEDRKSYNYLASRQVSLMLVEYYGHDVLQFTFYFGILHLSVGLDLDQNSFLCEWADKLHIKRMPKH